jgi:hypothetical protein
MKVRFSVLADASGSLGGLTASHNRAGQYLRARVVPTDPRSGQQTSIRTILGQLATGWGVLTAAQQQAWTTYAINVPITDRFGDPLTLTGQQMYIRNNTARIRAGLARVDDGPTTFSEDSLSAVGLSGSAAADQLSVSFDNTDGWANEDDAALLIWGSREKASSINFFKGPYRYAGKIDGDSVTPPTSPDTSLTNPFNLTQNNVFFGRAMSVRVDGRISPVQFIGPANIGA